MYKVCSFTPEEKNITFHFEDDNQLTCINEMIRLAEEIIIVEEGKRKLERAYVKSQKDIETKNKGYYLLRENQKDGVRIEVYHKKGIPKVIKSSIASYFDSMDEDIVIIPLIYYQCMKYKNISTKQIIEDKSLSEWTAVCLPVSPNTMKSNYGKVMLELTQVFSRKNKID